MADFPFDVVAFDLDGTLADTSPDLAAALNHALTEFGRPSLTPERVRHLVGHGARALLRRGLAESGASGEDLIDLGFPLLIDFYERSICVGTRLFEGVEEALDELKQRGVRTALCTNKPEQLTHLLLNALGWTYQFDTVVGGDTFPVRKPDPAPLLGSVLMAGGGAAVFVGDSITDADTARSADLPFVAVSFGFSDRPVARLGADAVIDHYSALIPAVERLAAQAACSR